MASSKSSDFTLTSTVDLLAPGVSMPRLGFGIYRVQPSETVDVVLAALGAGYRHIDSAQLYNNEAKLGQAIRKSGVAREDVFLTTKIRYPGVNKAKTWKKVLDSVKKVSGAEVVSGRKRKRADDGAPAEERVGGGAEYVDLFLVHTPYGGPNAKKERREMWLALERAFEEGKARAIGVSNYKVEHLEEMREYAKVWPPHINQIQLNPWTQQREVDAYCRDHGIVVQAFSPLARGDRWDEPVVNELADKYGKSPAQLLIRYALQKRWVPLPKSERPERMKANTEVFDFAIEDGDMEMLDGLDGKKLGYFE
ncbi:hypothetical protein LA080_011668 [Diaporthe eres]|uniref:NADP-dependent oxidoreductase domain-containing protein n=1 Tax=Diaporthe vaccinii TaxID=105482 RepID=A0ABR4FCI1_9PEZI|nr:hypothetical protein LA080_011668 [Diaporthe eres]